ncbi:nitroreductase / dihydropteridine reductase [Sphingobacterium wenxiniae]|uniref:Nitroreductase / dihydropteridine reductase n=1 Tax=Sphingobacterium wenxiniae TaxID=683125 RepID=A0A1I6PWT6_9SPHI|nr:nitroreductase / dihydropteridine reductase [Sphingobacterium wenxiniae]
MAEVSYFNEHKINDASHLVVFTVIDKVEKFEEQIQQNLPQGSIDYYNNFLKPLPEAEIKSWLQHQVYLSLGFFLSGCAVIGIDSTPMEGIKNAEYDKILKLDGYKTLFAVAIGYRNPEDSNQPSRNPKSCLSSKNIIHSI